jgi:hypothetical protein
MFIGDAKKMVQLDCDFRSGKSDTANYLLVNIADNAKFLKENVSAAPNHKGYSTVADYIQSITGIAFQVEDAKLLLDLYPRARIKVAEFGIEDSDVKDEIAFSVSHFFLGCSWPTYGEQVDHDSFVDLLKRQANKVGFQSVKSETSS